MEGRYWGGNDCTNIRFKFQNESASQEGGLKKYNLYSRYFDASVRHPLQHIPSIITWVMILLYITRGRLIIVLATWLKDVLTLEFQKIHFPEFQSNSVRLLTAVV